MRVTTAFNRLLRLDGVNVTDVEFLATIVRVTVALRRRRLVCGHCGYTTRFRYDTRPVASTWRHLDLGVWQLELRASLRRLRCPTHGVVVEGVPFARPGAKLTRDFDDLLAWLATKMDKTSISRLCRVSWRTVGRACERVVATELDEAPVGVVDIGGGEHFAQQPPRGGQRRPRPKSSRSAGCRSRPRADATVSGGRSQAS